MIYKIIFPIILIILIITLFAVESPPALEYNPVKLQDTVEIKIDHERIAKSKQLHKYFKRRHEKIGFNGSVLFAENGEIVYKNVFGYADVKKKIKISDSTKFQLASVAKPFTTYGIMLLKQQDKLSYEDSIQTYFPKFPYKGITIRLLMIHKSGLPEYFYFADRLWEDRNTPISNKDVIDLMIEHQPQRYYLPDRKYNYINTNYCILAAIIEKISGDSFEQFMKNEVFEPLEMHNTFIYSKGRSTIEKTAQSAIPDADE